VPGEERLQAPRLILHPNHSLKNLFQNPSVPASRAVLIGLDLQVMQLAFSPSFSTFLRIVSRCKTSAGGGETNLEA
jgi:hypothetical protein